MKNQNVTNSKITPQAIEAEKAVLSAMMIDEGSAAEVMDILRAECFYDNANREIFSAIRKLFINNTKKIYRGVANLGYRPTFKQKKILLEVNLFNFSGNLYNKKLSVEFMKFIRGEKKFNGIGELRNQIKKDIIIAKKIK